MPVIGETTVGIGRFQMLNLTDPAGAGPAIQLQAQKQSMALIKKLVDDAIRHEQCKGSIVIRVEVERIEEDTPVALVP